jgi:hypothetical protein
MNKKQIAALRENMRNVKKYSPLIWHKLRAAGRKSDPAFVFAAAQYYPCLKRLAEE